MGNLKNKLYGFDKNGHFYVFLRIANNFGNSFCYSLAVELHTYKQLTNQTNKYNCLLVSVSQSFKTLYMVTYFAKRSFFGIIKIGKLLDYGLIKKLIMKSMNKGTLYTINISLKEKHKKKI